MSSGAFLVSFPDLIPEGSTGTRQILIIRVIEMSAGKETASSSTVTKPTKTEQTLFEEDDEFEEFPAEGI